MQIRLNGSPADTNASDVLALLSELGLSNKPVIVEYNQTALLKAEHPSTPLSEGDQLEIITLAAGG